MLAKPEVANTYRLSVSLGGATVSQIWGLPQTAAFQGLLLHGGCAMLTGDGRGNLRGHCHCLDLEGCQPADLNSIRPSLSEIRQLNYDYISLRVRHSVVCTSSGLREFISHYVKGGVNDSHNLRSCRAGYDRTTVLR